MKNVDNEKAVVRTLVHLLEAMIESIVMKNKVSINNVAERMAGAAV